MRAEKLGNGSFRFSGRGAIMGRSCSPGVGPAQLAVAGPEGFSMGAWTEDRRDASERWGARFEFEERSSVRCGAGPRDGKTRTSIAPSVSIERIARGITVEEGGSAVDRGARVEAIADAIPLVEGAPADAWRSIPIRVTVSLVGYETIEFHWRLDATDDENARVMPRDSR